MEAEPPAILTQPNGKTLPRLIASLKDLERMLMDVSEDNFAVTLDIGHMYVVRENLINVIEKIGKKIVHVHVEDVVDRLHIHLIPGTGGMVDFEGAFRALNRIGYKGFLSVELEAHVVEPEKAALETIQYLDSLLYRIGLK